ncbi:zonular occludens toxin family protein [Candidatus Fukatsuia endosymbiont of Tuberolachnus salignus]|uniref:zonular occludens toxin family protein n=1 Tax=Candidatus Fukatsuia endosymbiont of Tuberolachnus salignus TaxID=3077957 RepID=UPI00313B611E
MAISAYVGVPGSGKSYEVVASVIIPACLAGRRVVTNIYGISVDKIADYCVSVKKADRTSLGHIIYVENEQVQQETFFPYKTAQAALCGNTFCQSGDLICIDEAWRIWPTEKKIPVQHQSFIAEHRHFTNERTGVCCDLVVINQSVTNLPRFIKDRIETTYRMQKLLALGLRTRYRVDVFTGIRLFKSTRTTSYQCAYDKAIFALYHSYEGGKGTELTVDKRQNVFSSARLGWVVIGMLLLAGVSVTFLVYFFTQYASSEASSDKPAMRSVPVNPSPIVTTSLHVVPASPEKPAISARWRVAGKLAKKGQIWVVLADNAGRLRAEPVSQFAFEGVMMTGTIDGERVTVWSGGIK